MATHKTAGLLPLLLGALLLGGCAGDLPKFPGLAAKAGADETAAAASPQAELVRATDYWGKQFQKNPADANAAIAYARNLKALGQKSQALAVLQQAAQAGSNDRKLAGEYGRLALELDQVNLAEQLLTYADDPGNPDWKVISARGTVLAKKGQYKDAIPYYERALTMAPNQPSLLNNLALAYTMSGEAPKAEGLLRQAAQTEGGDRKVRQNLALVLGLQGKYDEAKQVAMKDAPAETAAADTELVRSMVRLDPKAAPAAAPAGPQVQVAKAPAAGKGKSKAPAAGQPWQVQVAETAEPAPEPVMPLKPASD